MKLVKKDFICPYCFSKQNLYRIKFRCQNSPTKCSPEVDNEYAVGVVNVISAVKFVPETV